MLERWTQAAVFVAVVACVAAPTCAQAETWRWHDGAGGTHLAPSQEAVPAEFRANAEPVQPVTPAPSTALPPALTREMPSAAQPGLTGTSLEGQVDRNGHDKAWWQNRVAELETKIAETKASIEKLTAQRTHETFARKKREVRQQITEAQQALSELQRQLTEVLPAEARAAGAPRAWLR